MASINAQYKPCLTVKDLNTWGIKRCDTFKKNKSKINKTLYLSLEKYLQFLENQEKDKAIEQISNILLRLKQNNCLSSNSQGGPTNLQIWQNKGCNAYEKIIQICADNDIDYKDLDKIGSPIGITDDAHQYLKKQYQEGKLERIPEKGLYLILALQNRHVQLKELNEKFRSRETNIEQKNKDQQNLERQRQLEMEKRKAQSQQLKRSRSTSNVGKPNCKPKFSSAKSLSECCSGRALTVFGNNYECA